MTQTDFVQIQERRDVAANWTADNPVLAQGEHGLETDTGREKVGDGSTAWNALPYSLGSRSLQQLPIEATVTVSGNVVVGAHNPFDATHGVLTATLGAPSRAGLLVAVEKWDNTSNSVTVSGTLRGVAGASVVLELQHQTVLLESDSLGSWWPLAGYSDVAALDGRYARLDGAAFTAVPTAPTPAAGDNSTKLATTEFVDVAVTNIAGQSVVPSHYRETIVADNPVSYWRLGEKGQSTVAYDQMGANNGTYVGSQAPNLVTNPSFETDLSGWYTGSSSGTVARSTAAAFSGTASALITRANTSPGNCFIQGPNIPVRPNTTYTASVYAMVAVAGSGELWRLSGADNGSPAVYFGTAGNALVAGSWTRLEVTFTTSANATFVYFTVNDDPSTAFVAGAAIYVDAVQVTETSAAVPYSDTQGLVLGSAGALNNDPDPAVKFDGQSGQVNAASPNITVGTVEAWVNTTHNSGGVPETIVANAPQFGLFIVSGELQIYDWGAASPGFISSGVSINDGRWHHAVLVFQSGVTNGSQFYVDGSPAGSAFTFTAGSAATVGLEIGNETSNQHYLPGSVDEVAVYNYVLTPAQIAAHYAAGVAQRPIRVRTVTAATTIISGDEVVGLDGSGAAFTQVLPSVSGWSGVLTLIADATNSNLVTLTPAGTDTITAPGKASVTSLTLGNAASGAPYQAVDLLPDTSVSPNTWRIR